MPSSPKIEFKPKDRLTSLPDEILAIIVHKLSLTDIMHLKLTSFRFWRLFPTGELQQLTLTTTQNPSFLEKTQRYFKHALSKLSLFSNENRIMTTPVNNHGLRSRSLYHAIKSIPQLKIRDIYKKIGLNLYQYKRIINLLKTRISEEKTSIIRHGLFYGHYNFYNNKEKVSAILEEKNLIKFEQLINSYVNKVAQDNIKYNTSAITANTLYLRYIGIPRLPHDLLDLIKTDIDVNKITVLDLPGNNLWYLPSSIQSLTQLKSIKLDYNNFHKIPPVICKMKQIEEIILDANLITSIPESIKENKKLKTITLSQNLLTDFPAPLIDCESLTQIDLKRNMLDKKAIDFIKLYKYKHPNVLISFENQGSLNGTNITRLHRRSQAFISTINCKK